MSSLKKNRKAVWLWRVIGPFMPVWQLLSVVKLPSFISDLRKFRAMGGRAKAEDFHLCLLDKTVTTPVDYHYFYQSVWGLKKVMAAAPANHVDVASDVRFVGMLTAITDIDFVDIRPFIPELDRFNGIEGTIVDLPFEDDSRASVSCISVVEHIGLGRYGDPIDPDGMRTACSELQRVVARGGDLYLGLPVGRSRVCYNAHRVTAAKEVVEMFSDMELVDFSVVTENGRFLQNVDVDSYDSQEFCNGLFHFRKTADDN